MSASIHTWSKLSSADAARIAGSVHTRDRERGGEEKLREGEDEAEYIFVWVDSDEKREKRERS